MSEIKCDYELLEESAVIIDTAKDTFSGYGVSFLTSLLEDFSTFNSDFADILDKCVTAMKDTKTEELILALSKYKASLNYTVFVLSECDREITNDVRVVGESIE